RCDHARAVGGKLVLAALGNPARARLALRPAGAAVEVGAACAGHLRAVGGTGEPGSAAAAARGTGTAKAPSRASRAAEAAAGPALPDRLTELGLRVAGEVLGTRPTICAGDGAAAAAAAG